MLKCGIHEYIIRSTSNCSLDFPGRSFPVFSGVQYYSNLLFNFFLFLLSAVRHVSGQRPGAVQGGAQGFCGGQRRGNRGRRRHCRHHDDALRQDARPIHRRPPLPLLHPTQTQHECPVCWPILLACLSAAVFSQPGSILKRG